MSDRCHGIRDKLSAYADGELPAADEERVRAHVAECVECREALAAIALADEAVAGGDVSRSEEDWERLAARVDAAVAQADEQDRRAAEAEHGWRRRRKPGFFGGLLPAPVAFGSAGTLVAALLVVLMHGLLEERTPETDLLTAEDMLAARGRPRSAERDSAPPPPPPELRALGYVVDAEPEAKEKEEEARQTLASFEKGAGEVGGAAGGGRAPGVGAAPRASGVEESPAAAPAPAEAGPVEAGTAEPAPAEEPVEAGPAEPAPAEASRADASPDGRTDSDEAALRPVEPGLRISEPAADAPIGEEEAEADVDAEAEADVASGSWASTSSPEAPPPDPRTLSDLAEDYAKRRAASPPPPPPPAPTKSLIRQRGNAPSRPDAMTRALQEQRRETDQALGLALAREVYLFAQERRQEGDIEGAISALSLLLDNENGRIREQAWADLISLEGDKAIEEGEVVEIARVGSAADAFLREYPSSRFRLGVIKRRVRLWAEAVEQRPDLYCEPARAAETDWQQTFGAQTDPENAESSRRIRQACGW
jgi:hypothetical protein